MSAIEIIVSCAGNRVTWSLGIFAGSLASIVSTSYIRPPNRINRFLSLLLIPGWVRLYNTIDTGDKIIRRAIVASNYPDNKIVLDQINDDFIMQIDYFNQALIIFCAWLSLYLLWALITDLFPKHLKK